MADTRKDRRAPVALKVRFKSATVDEFVEQYAMDISRGGIFIKSRSPMPIGTLLKFEFQLKDESRLIHGVGRVVWKRDSPAGEDKPPGMGIKFIKMDPQSRTLVEEIVSRRGDEPGEFEQGRTKIKSAKKTEAFFPAALPRDQLPLPEDSTQVRHASEFLAEALSAGDQDAAKEAAESAEKARNRTNEIAKERSEAVRREKERSEDEAEDVPVGDEPVGEERAASEPNFAEPSAEEPVFQPPPSAEEATARADDEAKAERREREVASAPPEEKRRSSSPAKAISQPPPEEEGRSMALPIAIGALAVAGIVFFVWNSQQTTSSTVDDPSTIGGETEVDAIYDDPILDAGVADVVADLVEEVVMVGVRVASSPPGATVEVDGAVQDGLTPFEIELPVGHEVEVVVRSDGYVSGRQMVTAEQDAPALTFALEALPWVLVVDISPPGARVTSGGNVANEIGEITLDREPSGPVSVRATMPGYTPLTERVLRPMFTVEGERMLARVSIHLLRRRAGRLTMATDGGEPTGTGDEVDPPPTMERVPPTMERVPPTMERVPPTMEPASPTMAPDGVPDNPF